MKKHFYNLDIAKLLFTYMIANFHLLGSYEGISGRGGYIAVEFFFIASSFQFMLSWESGGDITAWQDFERRIKRYYPHYLFSFVVMFLFTELVRRQHSFGKMMHALANQKAEIFMAYGSILSDEHTYIYNSSTWYLTVLLIVVYLFRCVLRQYGEKVIALAPLLAFGTYGFIYSQIGTTNNWRTHVFLVMNYGLLRGIAGVCAGMFCWWFYQRLREVPFSKWGGYGDLWMCISYDSLCYELF